MSEVKAGAVASSDEQCGSRTEEFRALARKGVHTTQELLILKSVQIGALHESNEGPLSVERSNATCRITGIMLDIVRTQARYGELMIAGKGVLSMEDRKQQDDAVLKALALSKLTMQERAALGVAG